VRGPWSTGAPPQLHSCHETMTDNGIMKNHSSGTVLMVLAPVFTQLMEAVCTSTATPQLVCGLCMVIVVLGWQHGAQHTHQVAQAVEQDPSLRLHTSASYVHNRPSVGLLSHAAMHCRQVTAWCRCLAWAVWTVPAAQCGCCEDLAASWMWSSGWSTKCGLPCLCLGIPRWCRSGVGVHTLQWGRQGVLPALDA